MRDYKTKTITVVLLLALFSISVKAQIFDTKTGVDTLKTRERISLHTNTTDWVLAIPNIGVEFGLNGRNYNRNAIGINIKWRWAPKHTFQPNIVYNLTSFQVYYRNYYHLKQIDAKNGVEPSKGILNKLFSCRRKSINHPKRTYYRGLYLDYSNYSFKFSKQGKQGKAATFGFTYGWLTPLYTFRNGHSLDFDMGINAGACLADITRFTRDRDDNCYRQTRKDEKKILPVLTEVRVGFVYRPNKYPITKRYRWKYDVDVNYHDCIDSINSARKNYLERKKRTDSLLKKMEEDFNAIYDSVANINKEIRANTKNLEAPRTTNNTKAAKDKNEGRGARTKALRGKQTPQSGNVLEDKSDALQPEDSTKDENAQKRNEQ